MQTKNKSIIIVVIAILVLCIFLVKNDFFQSLKITAKTTKTDIVQANDVINKDKNDQLSVQQKIKNIKKATKPIKIKTIPTLDVVFDNDPVVDANIILNKYSLCINHLNLINNISFNSYQRLFELKLDKKQKKFYKKFNSNCEKLNKDHPEYHLSENNKLVKQRLNAQTSSTWGKIIKGEIDPKNLSRSEIRGILKINDINILSQAPNLLKEYYAKVIHWDLEDILQNHHYDYTTHISNYAHQLYLCNIGDDCTANSNLMARLCYLNSKSCGLTYNEYINQILTVGQQADTQMALNYFSTQYQ